MTTTGSPASLRGIDVAQDCPRGDLQRLGQLHARHAPSVLKEQEHLKQSGGTGTDDDPWILKTPPGTSEYAIEDLHAMLKAHGDWMPLGNADEGKPVKAGTVEARARDESNPVGGYYGLRKGYRDRFANYVTPVLELLGLAELEHQARGNRVRAIR